jgi:peroxiredoxin
MPSFENLYRRYRSEGMTVLAVTIDKNASAQIKSFVNEYELSFPVLLDAKGEVERLYPSVTIPFTYVIDREGRVVARVDGAKNWESEETFEAIEYLLKKP